MLAKALVRIGSGAAEMEGMSEEPGTLEEVARLASDWFARHFARS